MQKLYINQISQKFQIPNFVLSQLEKSVDIGFNQYQKVGGDQRLLESLSKYYTQKFQTEISSDMITETQGIDIMYDAVLFTFLSEQDEVLSLSPVQQNIVQKFAFFKRNLKQNFIKIVDNKVYYDFDRVRKDTTNKTKFIFINDPCYLTGKKLNDKDIENILSFQKEYDQLHFLIDRRCDFLIDRKEDVLVKNKQFLDRSIILYDVGKMFNCQDWKVCFTIQNKLITDYINRYQSGHYFTPSTPMTMAFQNIFDQQADKIDDFCSNQINTYSQFFAEQKQQTQQKYKDMQPLEVDFQYCNVFLSNEKSQNDLQYQTFDLYNNEKLLCVFKDFEQFYFQQVLEFQSIFLQNF